MPSQGFRKRERAPEQRGCEHQGEAGTLDGAGGKPAGTSAQPATWHWWLVCVLDGQNQQNSAGELRLAALSAAKV